MRFRDVKFKEIKEEVVTKKKEEVNFSKESLRKYDLLMEDDFLDD